MSYLHGIDGLDCADRLLNNKRIGLITNPSGHDSALLSAADVIRSRYRLSCLFAPEHGVRGSSQAGEKIGDGTDPKTGVPVVSLYGSGSDEAVRKALADVDVLVYSMQDIGLRFYTYIYTMTRGMTLAREAGIPFVVLDRYGMLGLDRTSGTLLDPKYASGVGEYPIPSQYGLSCGEFAQYANDAFGIGCDLHVVPCRGLSRRDDIFTLGLPYIMPSPNLPTVTSVLCYVGTVLFEGTNLSEGRGTAKPFEVFGAPWIKPDELLKFIRSENFAGALFRDVYFRPSFSKNKDEVCGGVEIILRDGKVFDPFRFTLTVLSYLKNEYPEFAFIDNGRGGYFIDNLLGSDALRQEGFDPAAFIETEKEKIDAFSERAKPYRIYR